MSQYAQSTQVPLERSREQIMTTLERYGCDAIQTTQAPDGWAVEFIVHDRRVRFVLRHPSYDDDQFARTPSGRKMRDADGRRKAWQQAVKQRYRALFLAIKAKLEIVESDISCFEHEFLANIVDPVTNQTMGQQMLPLIAERYQGINVSPTLCLPGPNL